jgi:hypothetical protein
MFHRTKDKSAIKMAIKETAVHRIIVSAMFCTIKGEFDIIENADEDND